MSLLTEKRTHPRIDVNGKVRLKGAEMENFAEGELKNISLSGVLISTPLQFHLGDMLHIRLEPDEPGAAPVEMKAKIVRNHLAGDNAQMGYGCLILEASEFD